MCTSTPYFFIHFANAISEVNKMNSKNGRDIPLGLGMALMQNADAFFYFSGLDADKQQKIIDGSQGIKSRDEMKNYVRNINTIG